MAKRPTIYKAHFTRKDGKTIYDPIALKAGEAKAVIMKANKWTEEQYRKQYDIFKNKLRAYESFMRQHGAEIETQSPLEVLYGQARSKLLYGPNYEPSIKMRTIESFSAVSITKGRKLAAQTESAYSKARGAAIEKATQDAFAGFFKKSDKAREINETITDPVKKQEALAALAEHIHAKQRPNGEVMHGEEVGSDPAGADFDYSDWLN